MTPESLHGLPTAVELVEAAREWLETDIAPVVEGRDAFMVRVVANVLAQVEREMVAGDVDAAEVSRRLESLGYGDEVALCHAIRRGDAGLADPGVVEAVGALVEARLAVANPRYVERR